MKILGLPGAPQTATQNCSSSLLSRPSKPPPPLRRTRRSASSASLTYQSQSTLNTSNILPKDKDAFNAPAHDASIIDDRPFVLDLILDAGAIIPRCPIYARVIPGSVKLFQDKMLGPFVDSVMARHRKEGVAARFEKKRVAGLMAVGGA